MKAVFEFSDVRPGCRCVASCSGPTREEIHAIRYCVMCAMDVRDLEVDPGTPDGEKSWDKISREISLAMEFCYRAERGA